MTASPSVFPSLSAVVATLRAAGCVFAEDEARLLLAEAREPAALAELVARRAAGTPLEHVLGWTAFHGLRIVTEPGVFVPRRRTEFLVDEAARLAPPGSVVADLCCGTGAVGLALATALGATRLHATDIEPAAVRCARRNLARVGGHVHEGDLDAPLPAALRGRIGVLTANVPYVPTAEVALLPPEAREHEPAIALDGGADGLAVVRRVSALAPRWLVPGGRLLVETSERQAPVAAETFRGDGLERR